MGLSSVDSVSDLEDVRMPWAALQPSGAHGVVTADDSVRRHLLFFRFILLNGTIAAFLTAAVLQGWLDRMMATDVFHIIKLIGLVFVLGFYQCATRIVQLTHELNALNGGPPAAGTRAAEYLRSVRMLSPQSRGMFASTLKLKLGTRLGHVRYIANCLVMLGLVGTVVGFIVALTGVDPHAVTESSAVGPMVSTLLLGMGMAMYKTLAGIVLNLWLTVNYRLLEHGTVHYYTQLVERGERQ
jgi:MotA/TolQ/ExbB proton channel family